MSNSTIQAILKSKVAGINQHLVESATQKKQKYNNQIVEFDGYVFRSKKELGRYVSLRALQAAGEISDLKLQIPFQLNDGGKFSCQYVADFLYKDLRTGEIVVDDAKGKETNLFKRKAKLMFTLYGIVVKKS